jgi:hypothetical protein
VGYPLVDHSLFFKIFKKSAGYLLPNAKPLGYKTAACSELTAFKLDHYSVKSDFGFFPYGGVTHPRPYARFKKVSEYGMLPLIAVGEGISGHCKPVCSPVVQECGGNLTG